MEATNVPERIGEPQVQLRKIESDGLRGLVNDAEKLISRKLIESALGGDKTALRLCVEYLAAGHDRKVVFDLPPIVNSADASAASSAVLSACAKGTLSPKDAALIMDLIVRHVQILEATKIEERLNALEELSHEIKSTSCATKPD
jgi:hypothetical protein